MQTGTQLQLMSQNRVEQKRIEQVYRDDTNGEKGVGVVMSALMAPSGGYIMSTPILIS